jgi:hypothetical protein
MSNEGQETMCKGDMRWLTPTRTRKRIMMIPICLNMQETSYATPCDVKDEYVLMNECETEVYGASTVMFNRETRTFTEVWNKKWSSEIPHVSYERSYKTIGLDNRSTGTGIKPISDKRECECPDPLVEWYRGRNEMLISYDKVEHQVEWELTRSTRMSTCKSTDLYNEYNIQLPSVNGEVTEVCSLYGDVLWSRTRVARQWGLWRALSELNIDDLCWQWQRMRIMGSRRTNVIVKIEKRSSLCDSSYENGQECQPSTNIQILDETQIHDERVDWVCVDMCLKRVWVWLMFNYPQYYLTLLSLFPS